MEEPKWLTGLSKKQSKREFYCNGGVSHLLAQTFFSLNSFHCYRVPTMDIHTEELSNLPITNRFYGDIQEEGNNLFPKLNIMGKYLSSKCFIKMHIFA